MDEQTKWQWWGDAGVNMPENVNPTVLVAIVGLVGVILGSVLNFIQGLITNYYATKREKDQWERQTADKSRDNQFLKDKELREAKAIALRKALSGLAGIKALQYRSEDMDDSEKRLRVMTLAQVVGEGVGEIVIHEENEEHRKQIMVSFNNFLNYPYDYPDDLISRLQTVYSGVEDWRDEAEETGFRTFNATISIHARQNTFIKGKIIRNNYIFEAEIKSIDAPIRDSLVKMYPEIMTVAPKVPLALYLPVREADGQISYHKLLWQADIDITSLSPNDILLNWDNDFRNNLKTI